MEYHRQTHPDAELGRVVVMGGEARDVALVQELAGRLRCGVQLADPIAAAQRGGRTAGVDFSQPQPGWAVALGLSVAPTDL
jgi:Tfp pilus assembly PilM family ATPase